MKKTKLKYYHASRKLNWKPGDLIYPINSRTNNIYGVWLTTDPKPHFTLYTYDDKSIGKVRYNVYRVIPHGKIIHGFWNDLACLGYVEIVECLGECAKRGTPSKNIEESRALHKASIVIKEKY